MSDPVPVALSRLALTDFRNYSATSVQLDSRMIAFVGDNGTGKTNILEAISFLSAGRGLRRATLSDVARADGAGGWAVSSIFDGEYGETRMGTGLIAGEPGRRVRINGEEARSSEALLESFAFFGWSRPWMGCLLARLLIAANSSTVWFFLLIHLMAAVLQVLRKPCASAIVCYLKAERLNP